MKRFLILGQPEDLHAHYVAWALERAGYQATFINSDHDNCASRTTLYLDDVRDEFRSRAWEGAEAVWCRRLPRPALADTNNGNDGFAVAEERRFTKWLIEMQEESIPIRWINSPTGALSAENKFLQLKVARSHGIAVPRTLITTEPARFRDFLESEKTIVAKPLTSYAWEYLSGETRAAFAAVLDVRRGRELSDEDIALCVTMYQECIEKVADVRMVIMGQSLFAYKVIQNGEQHFDYRIGFFQRGHLQFEEIPVPALLRKKILKFMASMKINFASADFALTANGEFVFLDLNPSGQWLFIELESPETRIGPKFCSFFVHGSVDGRTADLFPGHSEYKQSDEVKKMEETFRQYSFAQAGPGNTWKERRA